jgi:uncharacterized protein DUF3253
LARVAQGDGQGARFAKIALDGGSEATRLRAAIIALAHHRGPQSSICPSDAARAVGGDDWRQLTSQSRTIAVELACGGSVDITQGGDVIDPREPPRGPIRIRIPPP